MPTEASLTHDLGEAIKKRLNGAIVIKHADRFNAGIPDMSVTWMRVTSWWEVKYSRDGKFKSPAIQSTMCRRLARHGYCFYIVYASVDGEDTVSIVRPELLSKWRNVRMPGFIHDWVARKIQMLHEGFKGVS